MECPTVISVRYLLEGNLEFVEVPYIRMDIHDNYKKLHEEAVQNYTEEKTSVELLNKVKEANNQLREAVAKLQKQLLQAQKEVVHLQNCLNRGN